ncbi:MAG: site-2 protease family protein [Phycisphaerales bacterium]
MNFATLLDLMLVVFGFSMLVVIHEFGHFAAARWAGVRVLAFAVGFGRAAVSFRKGLGVRLGSSEAEYQRRVRARDASGLSPTEYRLNMLPFGGYVKMLGQDDADPSAISDAPDSYQSCKIWKRMVIISAGVVLNVVAAMVMFMAVFGIGLTTEAPVIGDVDAASPASQARSYSAQIPDGLRAGDRVLKIDGDPARAFNDLAIAAAMTSRGGSLRLEIEREGLDAPAVFEVTPRGEAGDSLPSIGVGPGATTKVARPTKPEEAAALRAMLDSIGLAKVEPGMTLLKAGAIDRPANGDALEQACKDSRGENVLLAFGDEAGETVEVSIKPQAQLGAGEIRIDSRTRYALGHIAGLVPVLKVGDLAQDSRGYEVGLRSGDIFTRVGDVEFPSMFQGVSEIRSRAGAKVDLEVLRTTASGEAERLKFPGVPVDAEGRVGILISTTAETNAYVAATPKEFFDETGREIAVPKGAGMGTRACRIVAVNDKPVSTLIDVRRELQAASGPLLTGEVGEIEVKLSAVALGTSEEEAPQQATLTMGPADAELLQRLGWVSPFGTAPFDRVQTTLKARDPLQAVSMGFRETHKAMLQVYVTFARLFEGTVQVKDLKGPVGIAHVGTLVARKGWVWLLFFFALISVNLAVVNFLPLPIVDGGQFLLLVYEQIRGRPAPIAFQNAVAIAGLAVIGSLFLFITLHDIRNLFGF